MLSPKRVKHRKTMKGKRRGKAYRGSELHFGTFGIRALECGWLSNRVIEAARVTIMRTLKRQGKLWINVFPDKPLTVKPAETRMGKGKGNPEKWVAVVKPGRILFELEGTTFEVAKDALERAIYKLPIKAKFVYREGAAPVEKSLGGAEAGEPAAAAASTGA